MYSWKVHFQSLLAQARDKQLFLGSLRKTSGVTRHSVRIARWSSLFKSTYEVYEVRRFKEPAATLRKGETGYSYRFYKQAQYLQTLLLAVLVQKWMNERTILLRFLNCRGLCMWRTLLRQWHLGLGLIVLISCFLAALRMCDGGSCLSLQNNRSHAFHSTLHQWVRTFDQDLLSYNDHMNLEQIARVLWSLILVLCRKKHAYLT